MNVAFRNVKHDTDEPESRSDANWLTGLKQNTHTLMAAIRGLHGDIQRLNRDDKVQPDPGLRV